MTVALYPGTFDPLTNGHLDLIKRSIRMFDKVVVAIFESPMKGPLFSVEERHRLIEESTRGLSNIEIDTFSNTLLVFYAKQRQAHVIVRGLRRADLRGVWSTTPARPSAADGLATPPVPGGEFHNA